MMWQFPAISHLIHAQGLTVAMLLVRFEHLITINGVAYSLPIMPGTNYDLEEELSDKRP